jgi:small nuclear ribonucleoprotein (snRNP)-like protein
MNRILRSILLALLLILMPIGPLVQGQQPSTDSSLAARIKAEITRRHLGDKLNVTIKLRNGSELKGRITKTSDNMFTLKEDKTRSQRDIGYTDVARVKGRGLSKGAKFGILTAIIAGTVVIGALISLRNFDPFKNGVLR